MPRLEDQLKINVISEPEPEPEPVVLAGGSDLAEGKTIPDPVIDKLMDDMPMEDDDMPIDEPEFVLKPPPKSEDLFEVMSPTRPRSPLTVPEEVKPVKLTKTGRVKREKGINKDGSKRKPMSEEHKQKLAQARAKAHAKRRAMGAKSREMKSKERAKKDLEILAKEKDLDDELDMLKEKVAPRAKDDKQEVKEVVREVVREKKEKGITKEDLEEISLKTVIAMETMRKQRKAEKKKKQQEEQYKNEVMNTIRQAKPSWMTTAGQYADCF
jgi:hypothetical protein